MNTPQFKMEGTRVFQALAVRSGLKALQKGIKLNRAYTSTNCRATATKFTGKSYPAGKNGIQQAIDDLTTLIDAAKVTEVSNA
jgi:hypothetical protein